MYYARYDMIEGRTYEWVGGNNIRILDREGKKVLDTITAPRINNEGEAVILIADYIANAYADLERKIYDF